ncbi:MAG: ATP-binding protein [Candidatus Omnitrophica bacterium]|nr:ATP-binding protein [Candidatus Omnitrophota bacterium]MDD5671807.1 ATP-binding protein [Candidatus Omnitrophota bacterium]
MEKMFELIAKSENLPPFRVTLRELLKQSDVNEKKSGEILLAVQEVLTNVVRHAYQGQAGKIKVVFQDSHDQISVTIQDFGRPFDLTQVPDPELPKKDPGGLGIFLIKKLMDQVEYTSPQGEGNLLRLVKFKKNAPQVS